MQVKVKGSRAELEEAAYCSTQARSDIMAGSVRQAALEELNKMDSPSAKIWICIEATWTGYTSSQSRVVHREYRHIMRKNLETLSGKASRHSFSDGTANVHTVREVERKGNDEIHGYDSLVRNMFK